MIQDKLISQISVDLISFDQCFFTSKCAGKNDKKQIACLATILMTVKEYVILNVNTKS